MQVGVVEHQLEELHVFVGQSLIDLLVVVLSFLALFHDEHRDGQRQTDHRDHVARQFPPL